MTRKYIKAIFKGQNGSCGYETNKEYTLEISHDIKQYVTIQKFGSAEGYCNYSNVLTFLENWDNIRNVKP